MSILICLSQRRWWNMAQMSPFRTSKVRDHLSVLSDKVIPPVHATWWWWRPACLWLHRWSSLPSNSMSKQAAIHFFYNFAQRFVHNKLIFLNIFFHRQTTARISLQSQMQLLLQSQDPNERPRSPRFALFFHCVTRHVLL